eukprot:6425518-Pyramimonas_sp.AAC.1
MADTPAPDIMNGDKWSNLFAAIQEDNVLPRAEFIVRQATVRFHGGASGGKIALILLPAATSLAYISSDRRRDKALQGRALAALRKLGTKCRMAVG